MKASKVKPAPRTISIWKKANSETISEDTKSFTSSLFLSDNNETSVKQTWLSIQDHLSLMMENIPTKVCSTMLHQPWISKKLK